MLVPAESQGKLVQGRPDQVGQSHGPSPQEIDRTRRGHPQRVVARHFGARVRAYVFWREEPEASARAQEPTARHREPARTPGPLRTRALEPWAFPSRVSLWVAWEERNVPRARAARWMKRPSRKWKPSGGLLCEWKSRAFLLLQVFQKKSLRKDSYFPAPQLRSALQIQEPRLRAQRVLSRRAGRVEYRASWTPIRPRDRPHEPLPWGKRRVRRRGLALAKLRRQSLQARAPQGLAAPTPHR